jgi:polyisoprenoid-binding protein YceI
MKRISMLFLVVGLAITTVHAQTPPSTGSGQQTPPAGQQAAPPRQTPPQGQPPGQPGPPLGPNTWMIDSSHTSAQFSVRHMMVSTVRGTLGRVSGTVDYDGKSVDTIKADVTIDVAGLNTGVEGRDKDLRSPNFFDVATYPTITFKSKKVEAAGAGRFKLMGDLTMHGVTKEVTLDVEGPSPPLKQQNGALRIGASATTKVNRRDFNLNYSRLVESAPVVGDEINITIDIELNKRPTSTE